MPRADWPDALARVWDTLNRDSSLDALAMLHRSLSPSRQLESAERLVIGFDTNALYRVGRGRAGADILDYLRARHDSPLIVPGQTLQEVWNNQIVGVVPLAKALQSKLREIESEAKKLDYRFGARGEEARIAIAGLEAEYAEVFDEEAEGAFSGTVELFLAKATVRYVPRIDFAALARVRNDTKTPPGFKDRGDGDFFLWADFLYGLAGCNPDDVDGVVLVTNDTKADWSRNGFAHPILVAEATAVLPKPFELWTVRQLSAYVNRNE